MATVLANLQTAYANYAAILADISANPKLDYALDGESYSWTQYQAMILEKMLMLEEAIARAGGPFELRTQIVT